MSDPVGSRREARERVLTLLYEADTKGCQPTEVLEAQPLDPEPFVADVVAGVTANREEADALLGRFSRGWTVERMPVIDRAILRMAVYELAHRPDVPTGAIISEAVELAKRYSTDDSPRFVNGMLASIAAEVRPAD